jgi:hypothetical protein
MIIKNLLPKKTIEQIQKITLSDKFSWTWHDKNTRFAPNNCCVFQFVHVLHHEVFESNSEYFDLIALPVVEELKKQTKYNIKNVHRAKVNLITKMEATTLQLLAMEHDDVSYETKGNYISAIFYINDSDGDTCIFDTNHNIEEQTSPISNSVIIFDSRKIHRGTPPKKNNRRVVLNLVLELN